MKYFIIIAIIMSLFSCSKEVIEPVKLVDSIDPTYLYIPDYAINKSDDKERGITIKTNK